MRKFLIVTADDFGLHESVNDAVEQASRGGILTAASLMVGAPAADDAIRRARGLPNLRVGLHLVLADGIALLPVRSIPELVDDTGRFDDDMVTAGIRYFARPSVRRQLEAEIHAQYAAFARTGLVLDHVNAHKHFHLHPSLLGMLLRIGRNFGVRAVRLPREPLWFRVRSGATLGGLAGAALLSPWLSLLRRRLQAAAVACNDQVFGIAASGQMDEAALLAILARLPAGVTEVYLHPATRSGREVAQSMAGYRHADELAALRSPRVRAALEQGAVPTGGFLDSLRPR